MPTRLARYLTMPAITTATLMSIAFGATAAHAAAPADDQADSHGCPARTLCTWSGNNFNGTSYNFPVTDFHSKWYSFNNFAGYNPGTVDDNSASDAYLWNRTTKLWGCLQAGNWATDLNGVSGGYGYFFITYGVTGCVGLPPDPPGGV